MAAEERVLPAGTGAIDVTLNASERPRAVTFSAHALPTRHNSRLAFA
jgi:hypothetical protein